MTIFLPTFIFFVLPLITVMLIKKCLFIAEVVGASMVPSLHQGDRVLVLKYWPKRWLKKGDIVVAAMPDENYADKSKIPTDDKERPTIIKRISGIAGDTVASPEIKDFESAVVEGNRHWYIPHGYYFIEGDNPSNRADSQKWGPVHMRQFKGLVIRKMSK